jgi:hypothetical protein
MNPARYPPISKRCYAGFGFNFRQKGLRGSADLVELRQVIQAATNDRRGQKVFLQEMKRIRY